LENNNSRGNAPVKGRRKKLNRVKKEKSVLHSLFLRVIFKIGGQYGGISDCIRSKPFSLYPVFCPFKPAKIAKTGILYRRVAFGLL
jgi:hypothetical protein